MTTYIKTKKMKKTKTKTLKDLMVILSTFKDVEFFFYSEGDGQNKCFLEYDGLRYYEGNSGEFYAKYNTVDGMKQVKIDNWNELIRFVAEQ